MVINTKDLSWTTEFPHHQQGTVIFYFLRGTPDLMQSPHGMQDAIKKEQNARQRVIKAAHHLSMLLPTSRRYRKIYAQTTRFKKTFSLPEVSNC